MVWILKFRFRMSSYSSRDSKFKVEPRLSNENFSLCFYIYFKKLISQYRKCHTLYTHSCILANVYMYIYMDISVNWKVLGPTNKRITDIPEEYILYYLYMPEFNKLVSLLLKFFNAKKFNIFFLTILVQSATATEYTDCFSAER